MGFAISLLGGACLIFQDKFEDNDAVMATLVVFAKFGSAMSMCVCYLATPWIFPTMLCGTAFGICNLIGRACQSFAAFIADWDPPLPMIIFSIIALIGLGGAIFVKTSVEQENEANAKVDFKETLTLK